MLNSDEESEWLELEDRNKHDEINVSHIKTSKGASMIQSSFNIMCTMIGVGLIGLPAAMARTGWIGGILIIWICGMAAVYCGIILARCLNEGRYGMIIQTYPQLGRIAAGNFGVFLATFGGYGTCIGSSILFIITAIDQCELIFGPNVFSSYVWALLFVGVCLPFAFIKTLEHVSFIAVFGAVSAFLVLAVVVFEDSLTAYDNFKRHTLDSVDTSTELLQLNDPGSFSKGVVVIFFSYAAAAVFPEINRTMANPKKDFPTALNLSFGVAATLYSIMSIVSYAVFGVHVLTADNIISILPPDNMIKVISGLFCVHLLSAFLVCLNPVFREVERILELDSGKHSFQKLMINRTIIILICLIVAISVPLFDSVMAFVGASTVTVASFTCPCFFYLKLFAPPLSVVKQSVQELFSKVRRSPQRVMKRQISHADTQTLETIPEDMSTRSLMAVSDDDGDRTSSDESDNHLNDSRERLISIDHASMKNRRVLELKEIFLCVSILIFTTIVAVIGATQALMDMLNVIKGD